MTEPNFDPPSSRVAEVEDNGEEEERQCANMPKAWGCWKQEEADGIKSGVLGIPVVASVPTPIRQGPSVHCLSGVELKALLYYLTDSWPL